MTSRHAPAAPFATAVTLLGLLPLSMGAACEQDPPARTGGGAATASTDPEPSPESPAAVVPEGPAEVEAGQATAPTVRLDRGPVLTQLTPDVVERLREIASRYERSGDVFAKIGDSATVSRAFLECFGGDPEEVDLGSAEELGATVEHFRGGNAGGIDPFRRDSEAADVGWSARQLLLGNPPPVLKEVRAISPRFAFLLNGGNDVEGRDVDRFANRMLRLVDHLTSRGVIPILGTITPRGDDADAERWVRRYNGVVRAIADGQGIPMIDFHQALEALPRQGLARDRVHPNVLISGGETRPCDLRDEGLEYGSNRKNLLALRMLDRLRRTVVEGEPAPDQPSPPVEGEGSTTSPFRVTTLPFTDARSTADSPHRDLDRYGCSEEHDEGGPEWVYRLDVAEPIDLRAWAFSEGEVDVDVHLLEGGAAEGRCVARDDRQVKHRLAPGTWSVVVDTFVDGEDERSGDFLLVLDREPIDATD